MKHVSHIITVCNTWHVKDHNYYLLFHIRIYHCYSLIKCYSFINTFVSHRPRDNAGKYTRCRPIFRSGNSSTRDRFAMPRGRIVFASYLKKKGEGKGGREKSTIYIGQFRSRRAARTKLSEKYRRVNNTLIS